MPQAVQIFQEVLTLTPNHEETQTLLSNAEAQILQEREIADRKTEADRLARQKAEDERLAIAKAETERKAKEESDRLATQKAEADQKNVISTVTEQSAGGTKTKKTINDWLQIWWARGLILTVVMAVLGFVLQMGWFFGTGIVIFLSIVFGVFGFLFFPTKLLTFGPLFGV